MFLILPHSAEFRWGRVPWLVISLMVLCTAIYYAEDKNNEALEGAFVPYCQGIYDETVDVDDVANSMHTDIDGCANTMSYFHQRPYKDEVVESILDDIAANKEQEDLTGFDDYVRDAYQHYQEVRYSVPQSLDSKLMADPLFFNPLRSITSSLAHGSWWHLIGNLIFFFAFTPALEIVIGSRLRLAMVMVVVAIVCDLAYFISVQLFGVDPIPSLGFSGVVMGMIGLSGYLLPKVKIRTFVWFFFYARNWYLPAGLLAAWYIGWDAWYMFTELDDSGVNFVAHVFGGVAGYLLGRYWFKEIKEDIRHDVADEIEHHRAQRHDKFGMLSSYRSSRPHLAEANREHRAKREFSNFVSQIHKAVSVGHDAEAINLLLSRYDDYRHAIELYEEIYRDMLQWEHTRAILCLSRLLITEYINVRKYAKAIEVARTALGITPEFVFAETGQRELLDAMAKRQGITVTAPV
jgi:membrane associated rhomboid family serine protease